MNRHRGYRREVTRRLTLALACSLLAPAGAAANHGAVDTSYGPNGTGQAVYGDRAGGGGLVAQPYFAANTLGGFSCLTCKTLSFSQTTLLLIDGSDTTSSPAKAVVRRFTQNGGIDTRWGQNGRVTIEVAGFNAQGKDLAVLPDGRVTVLLNLRAEDEPRIMGIAMLLPDGTLDPSFGNGGVIRLRALPGMGGEAVAVDGYDRVVALGHVITTGGTFDKLRVARFAPDGLSFSRTIDIDPDTMRGFDPDLVVHPEGRIVVSGVEAHEDPGNHPEETLHIRRYTPEGRRDPAFSGDGLFTHRISGDGQPFHPAELVRAADGGYAFAAVAGFGSPQSFQHVLRLSASGGLEPTFGGDGSVVGTRASRRVHGLLADGSGTILTVGTDLEPAELSRQFLLTRYAADGGYDKTFGGGDGEVKADLTSGGDEAWDVVAQPSGRLVAAGMVSGGIGLAGFHGNSDRTRPDVDVRITSRSAARVRRAGRLSVLLSADEPVALRFEVTTRRETLTRAYRHLATPADRRFELAVPRRARHLLDPDGTPIAVTVTARDPVGNKSRRVGRRTLRR